MGTHADATRYHDHGQKKPADAGKPDAVNVARPVWRGPVRKRSSIATFAGWLPYPDPEYQEKNARDRLLTWASQESQAPHWAIGFLDEVWWSRFALPRAHGWQTEASPLRFVEQSWQKADPNAKALAWYGVLWQRGTAKQPLRDQMILRFVDGRPVSEMTTQFLTECCKELEAQGKTAWLLIWDNASWHASKLMRTWIREHNQQVKSEGRGVRILPLFLPKKSPWLNPIEPKWVHGKRAFVEPNGLLTAKELAQRICVYYRCAYEAHLALPEKASGVCTKSIQVTNTE